MISHLEYEELKKKDFIQEYERLLVLKYSWVNKVPWELPLFFIGGYYVYSPETVPLTLPILLGYGTIFVTLTVLEGKERREKCERRLLLIDSYPEIYVYRDYKRSLEEILQGNQNEE